MQEKHLTHCTISFIKKYFQRIAQDLKITDIGDKNVTFAILHSKEIRFLARNV